MNPPSLLQIVERLERLAGKLPSRIRKAVLGELTPLKQLFLQQRPPRFLFAGSAKIPAREIIGALLARATSPIRMMPLSLFAAGSISAFLSEERSRSSMPAALMIRLPSGSRTNSNIALPISFFFSAPTEPHKNWRSTSWLI